MSKHVLLIAIVCLFLPSTLRAEISLPHFFSDHMVLQRERAANIWGTADPNAEVTVSFKGNSTSVTADSDGHWRLGIETGAADANGAPLVIASNNDETTINDVLVGEVWLASGQSNMAFTMNRVPEYAKLIAQSNHPDIRVFIAPLVTAVEPQADIGGTWAACNPETIPNCSAVAFFFARKLQAELKMPIGVIVTAWGGKPVETFTSREALNTLPATKALVDNLLKQDANFDAEKSQIAYQARLDQWHAANKTKTNLPNTGNQPARRARKPAPPKRPVLTEGRPGVLFDSMIHPFIGYSIRGAIWYQGEANAKLGQVPYDQTLPLMIRDWRKRWNDEFSFYFVQLANFHKPSTEPGTADAWALLQDRMRLVLDSTPKTGMAILNDVGDANDIHPKNKQAPGERLALWALAKDYGRELVYSGPLYQSSQIEGQQIRIVFQQTGDGLASRGGDELKRFEIAGANQIWYWAEAKIESQDSVVVSSPEVAVPLAVRYAWAANPEGANLVNSVGLPTSIFRTDNWNDVEAPAQEQPAKKQPPKKGTKKLLKK